MSNTSQGHHFVFLLIGTFRRIIDDLHEYLADHDFPDARPMHGFVLQAIGEDSISISELGRRLGVSKQAAAKTVKQMESRQLVKRQPDPEDARASLIHRSERGETLLQRSGEYFALKQAEWSSDIGEERFREILGDLATIGGTGYPADFIGWLQSRP